MQNLFQGGKGGVCPSCKRRCATSICRVFVEKISRFLKERTVCVECRAAQGTTKAKERDPRSEKRRSQVLVEAAATVPEAFGVRTV
jgi:hypothetical protein